MTAEGRFEICFKRVEVRTEMEGRGMMSRRKENLSKTEGKQKRNFKKRMIPVELRYCYHLLGIRHCLKSGNLIQKFILQMQSCIRHCLKSGYIIQNFFCKCSHAMTMF